MYSRSLIFAIAGLLAVVSAGSDRLLERADLAIRATPQPSLNAVCGAQNGTATCAGTGFGACCSQFGYCGNDFVHCGTGCQSGYGSCGVQMPPTTWSSLGCYTDTTLLRTLNVSMLVSGNTVEKCQAACATGGYTYSGTEFGTQCFCGKELLNGGAPSEDGCTSPCAGNVAEICGGSNRLSIYTVTPIWQSMGCWTDATLSRTLNTTLSVSGNTIDKCQATCNANGFKYSGTEFGSQCFCGNAIMNNNIAVSDGCTMACQGNPNQICGGSGRLSLSLFA